MKAVTVDNSKEYSILFFYYSKVALSWRLLNSTKNDVARLYLLSIANNSRTNLAASTALGNDISSAGLIISEGTDPLIRVGNLLAGENNALVKSFSLSLNIVGEGADPLIRVGNLLAGENNALVKSFSLGLGFRSERADPLACGGDFEAGELAVGLDGSGLAVRVDGVDGGSLDSSKGCSGKKKDRETHLE
jgi:hypothetical protein